MAARRQYQRFRALLARTSPNTAQHQAARDATPITPTTYAHYGAQIPAAVLRTDFARQMAERLIDGNGKLDLSPIPGFVMQLSRDTTLSSAYRTHAIKTLDRMQSDPELAAVIHSICEAPRTLPKGPAADIVRATLNLPPGHPLSKNDARKAVVMALLGYLRQDEVGSCFSTAVAICLHEDTPARVARDMKEMLEENQITFQLPSQNRRLDSQPPGGSRQGSAVQRPGPRVPVPLNQRVSHAKAENKILLQADGKVADSAGNPYDLHDTPGMHAALTALGISPAEMQRAVNTAISQMNLPEEEQSRVTNCREIIQKIAGMTPGAAPLGKRIAAALDAFAGMQDVRLLRAWEYTLATHAASRWRTLPALTKLAIFSPVSARGNKSLIAKNNDFIATSLKADPRFAHTHVDHLSRELRSKLELLVRTRLVPQFTPDVKNLSLASDGVSSYGRFNLYDRTPPDAPAEWKAIDSPQKFQETIAQLVDEAATQTTASQGVDDAFSESQDPRTEEALRLIAEDLKANIRTPSFIDQIEWCMNPSRPGPKFDDTDVLPWKCNGAPMSQFAPSYGGKCTTYPDLGAFESAAHPIVEFLGDQLSKMAPALTAQHEKLRSDFKIPVAYGPHAFTLMPLTMREIWENGKTAAEWIDAKFKASMEASTKKLTEERPTANLTDFLSGLTNSMELEAVPAEKIHANVREVIANKETYTYQDVHDGCRKFSTELLNPARGTLPEEEISHLESKVLAAAEFGLMRFAINSEPIIIGDANWQTPDGNPKLMGLAFNPFSKKIELCVVTNDKDVHDFIGSNPWAISTPLTA